MHARANVTKCAEMKCSKCGEESRVADEDVDIADGARQVQVRCAKCEQHFVVSVYEWEAYRQERNGPNCSDNRSVKNV